MLIENDSTRFLPAKNLFSEKIYNENSLFRERIESGDAVLVSSQSMVSLRQFNSES